MSFDEQPDGDPHGECAFEIALLRNDLAAEREKVAILLKLATCGCGDGFTEQDPGTCGNCVVSHEGIELADLRRQLDAKVVDSAGQMLYDEIERLKAELADAERRSFVKSRICYRGYSYGTGSQEGIDSLRDAIERNGD